MEPNIQQAVYILWDYLQLHEEPNSADCLLVLGSRDDRVAVYAADLMREFNFRYVVISGGDAHHNDLLSTDWAEATEAEHFLKVMQDHGARSTVLLETKATNTGENAALSYKVLHERAIAPKTLLVVTKPYMERRAKATFEMQWPGILQNLTVCSWPGNFDAYINTHQTADAVINIMVGDFQRIVEYPRIGLQSKQHIPAHVMQAFERLVAAGYTKHLVHTM